MPSKLQPAKMRAQLGGSHGAASSRLIKDLLFDFVQKAGIRCFRCGGELCRKTFSVEHKEPWLDSEDPVKMFFSLENISYSHFICNVRAARRFKQDPEIRRQIRNKESQKRRAETPVADKRAARRERYLRLGR